MTDKHELLPCPFCDDLAWLHCDPNAFAGHCDGGSVGWRIECEGKCHSMTCWWHSKTEAIAAWNTRPQPTQSATMPTNEQIGAARIRFILAAAKIEPDVRLRELTDEETNSLIEAALSHDAEPVTEKAAQLVKQMISPGTANRSACMKAIRSLAEVEAP